MPIGNPAGYLPQQAMDERERVMQARQPQSRAAQLYQKASQSIQQKRQMVQQRQGDLQTADRMLKILDPTIAKPARQFLTRELGQRMGVDPKSETFKGVSQMINSLDPDSLQSLRSMFSTTLQDAEPGKVQEIVRGVMTGQVPMHDLVSLVQRNAAVQGQPSPIAEPQPSAADGQSSIGPNLAQQGERDQRVVEPFQQGDQAGAPVRSFEGERTVPPSAQQASPQLVGALGLDSTKSYRNVDLQRGGFRVPFDPKDQETLAQSINTRAVGISSTIKDAALMTQLFEGRPEVLGPVGSFVRGLQSTVRQAEGLLRLVQPNVESDVNINDSQTQQLVDEATKRLAKAHGLDATAEDSARIESMVMGLAYRMAIARDIPGNRLTNAIINQHLVQIGQSSSPEEFKAVLTDTIDSLLTEFDSTMRRQTGVSGYEIVSNQLSNEEIGNMAQNADILPANFAKAIRDEAIARRDGEGQPSLEPSSPTIEEEQATLGQAEIAEKQSKIEQREFQNRLSLSQELRARRSEARAERREERMTAAQEQANTLARERFEFQQEKYEESEERRRQERFQDAFQRFGAAIAGSYRGGSIGVSGGGQYGQNIGAFQIAPAPQRRPPAIPRVQ